MHSQRFLDLRNFCNTFWLCQWKIGNFKSSSSNPINMRQKEWIQYWLGVWIKGQRSIVAANATLPKPRQSWSCEAVKPLHSRTNGEALTGFSGSEDALAEFENNKSDQSPILVCSTFFLSRGITTPSLQLPLQNVRKNPSAQILTGRFTHNANITKNRAFTQEIYCNHPLKIIVVCCFSSVCKCGPVIPLVCVRLSCGLCFCPKLSMNPFLPLSGSDSDLHFIYLSCISLSIHVHLELI